MKTENENSIDQDAGAFSVPNEIVHFFRDYFMGEKTDPEAMSRAELLSKTLIKFMLQLHQFGVTMEYQPLFIACNYVRPRRGDIDEFERTYETIGDEPYAKFNLRYLTKKFEQAYKKWFEKTYGVELSDEAAEILGQWGGVLKDGS